MRYPFVRVMAVAAGLSVAALIPLGARLGSITTPPLNTVSLHETSRPTAVPTQERETVAPSARGPRLEEPPLTLEHSFILVSVAPAQASQQETKVPASVTIAQAMLESDLGRSGLSQNANNYFGIKARPDPGPAGVVYMNTWEVVGGKNVTVKEPFRAYHNADESFVDHGKFLSERPLYSAAFKYTGDPKQFAREIHKAGYATDPNYSSKLIALMDKFNLYQYDLK
ncbi:MAG: glycoside hydrolase family 73 protein [Chloroflexi bacterium]|nr:glycoside hydrolase family 73 protein [Chloroflexota bacterium]